MSVRDPYEPPASRHAFGETIPEGEGDLWRDGPLVVFRRGGRWPDRCIKCNRPAEGIRFFRTVSVGALNPRSVQVEFGLCRAHRLRARLAEITPILGVVYGLGVAAWYAGTRYALLGVALAVFALIVARWKVRARTVSATRIEDRFVWLRGAHPEFLDELPSV